MAEPRGSTPQPYAEGELLLQIERSAVERLHVTLERYRGRPYISLRVFFCNAEGVWLPTKKGCSLRLKELQGIRDALSALLARLGPDAAP